MIKGVTDEKHIFYKSKLNYEFECRPEYRPVKKIHQIVGFFGVNKHTFKSGQDYD